MLTHDRAGRGEDRSHVGGTPKLMAPLTRLTPARPTLIRPSFNEMESLPTLISQRPTVMVISSDVSLIVGPSPCATVTSFERRQTPERGGIQSRMPERLALRPVMSPARDGEQTGKEE